MSREGKSRMILPILLTVLFTEFLSSATPLKISEHHFPIKSENNDFTSLAGRTRVRRSKPLPESFGTEYELVLRQAESILSDGIPSPHAQERIDWILQERETLTSSRQLYKRITDLSFIERSKFWKCMDRYARYEYRQLKKSLPNVSLRSRMPLIFPSFVSSEEKETFMTIHQLMETMFDTKQTLTKVLLNLQDIRPVRRSEWAMFKHAIVTAIKLDANRGQGFDKMALKDLARVLVRFTHMYSAKDPNIPVYIMSNESVQKVLGKLQTRILIEEYERELVIYEKVLLEAENTLANKMAVPCRNSPSRRRRRSFSGCLLSEEEYGEVVRKVEEKEVLNTEKFLELLDRVTAEDPAAKRQQLLELGASLAEDPEVALEGDYVAEFKDVVKPLDQTVPSEIQDLQLLENPVGHEPLVAEPRALPLDHLSPGEIYSPRPIVQSQKIFYEPLNIHEPVIHLEEFKGVNFHEPMTEFKPLSVAEIIRPIEIAPVPEFRFPIPKFKLPIIRRG